MTLATATTTRETGGLLKESAGGATDSQINTAIEIASKYLSGIVSRQEYNRILAVDGSSSYEDQEQQRDFTNAEKRFAVAFLPRILTNTQLQATGYKLESTIGKATTKFANTTDINVIADFWNEQAMKYLAPYVTHSFFDDDDEEFGWESDDGCYGLSAI
jgi:hypothetical protein